MSKKHFTAAAEYIRRCDNAEARAEMVRLVILLNDNPSFDKGRFLAACEPKK